MVAPTAGNITDLRDTSTRASDEPGRGSSGVPVWLDRALLWPGLLRAALPRAVESCFAGNLHRQNRAFGLRLIWRLLGDCTLSS